MISDYDLTAQAGKDVRTVHRWYRSKSVSAAKRFLDSFDETITRILHHPHSFVRVDSRHRFAKLKKYPYLVLYRVYSHFVLILRVGHTRRSSRYWKKGMKYGDEIGIVEVITNGLP